MLPQNLEAWFRDADLAARRAIDAWRSQQSPEILAAFDLPPSVCRLRASVPQVDGYGNYTGGSYQVGTALEVWDRSPFTKTTVGGDRILNVSRPGIATIIPVFVLDRDLMKAACDLEREKTAETPAKGMGVKDGRGYGPYDTGYYNAPNGYGGVLPYGPNGEVLLSRDYDFQPTEQGTFIPLKPPRLRVDEDASIGFHADKMIFLGHRPVAVVGDDVVWWSGVNLYTASPLARGMPSGFTFDRSKVVRLMMPALRPDQVVSLGPDLGHGLRESETRPTPPIPAGTLGFAVVSSR